MIMLSLWSRSTIPNSWTLLQVIVVDVENRDATAWQNLTSYDGGLSGWRLLWDRWCPIPQLRCALGALNLL